MNDCKVFTTSIKYITHIVGPQLEDIAEEEQPDEEEDFEPEDEMADFIVDEEEVDEDGIPIRYSLMDQTFFI